MAERTVITIGNFDGMHVGHRRIVSRAAEIAQEVGAKVVAMTFYPSPASVLRPGFEPPRLMDRDQRLGALRAAGVNEVVVLTPTPEVLTLTAEQFIAQVVERYHPVAWVEGTDFRFGHNRAGDVRLLQQLSSRLGFSTYLLDKIQVSLSDQLVAPVSSTLIRWLLAQGRVADATRCLGQPFSISGNVIAGNKQGRTIGIPTANLDPVPMSGRALPVDGVYAGRARLKSGAEFTAAISVGVKPTFGQNHRLIEAHLLGFKDDLYDQTIEVVFDRWVRDQQPFPSIDTLKRQIMRDIARISQWHERTIGTNLSCDAGSNKFSSPVM